jgi:4-diphosphocytidyl-2-C-methyl-D-erythritol kinase
MASHPPQVRTKAYAKINLGLRVTGRRKDGYHDICTVFHRIDLFDDVTLDPSGSITVHATDPDVPSDERNICHKAAQLVAGAPGREPRGVRIGITKRIPAGAGLGGGSADAAAVLSSLPAFWGKTLPPSELRSHALSLGSDVPFFLGQGSALGTGRGEVLEYFTLDVPFAILLCTPPVHVPTAWAYARVAPRPWIGEDLRGAVLRGMHDPAHLWSHVVNDFEAPVIAEHPVIGTVKETMKAEGALYASMSGSGSSVYGFFEDAETAGGAARALALLDLRTFITPPHFRL